MKKAVIISAFPACGKSYAFNNYQHVYTMLDSDSSNFSWIKDDEGNNTKERNPDFPNNYIKHIQDNTEFADIIFVSSHKVVREALHNAGIKFTTVVPTKDSINEYVGRMYRRGNPKPFIDFIIANWDNFLEEIRLDTKCIHTKELQYGEYLSLSVLGNIINTSK